MRYAVLFGLVLLTGCSPEWADRLDRIGAGMQQMGAGFVQIDQRNRPPAATMNSASPTYGYGPGYGLPSITQCHQAGVYTQCMTR